MLNKWNQCTLYVCQVEQSVTRSN